MSTLPPTRVSDIRKAFLEFFRERGHAVFVPSAGRTATPAYKILRTVYGHAVDWQRVHIVQMDEYVGLGATDPLSFAFYLSREFVTPLRAGIFTHFNDERGALMRPLDA